MNKRAVCPDCGFIISRCLCSTLRSIDNKTHLIILQHPSETTHALNTVALMKKSFLNITLITGEDFSDNQTLNNLISTHKKSLALLYPTEKSEPMEDRHAGQITHLILIDGTWKKAHKMYSLSKNLHCLTGLKLEISQPTQYKIRSSQLAHSLSTLEASICALAILEKNLDSKALMDSFNKMIEFQIEKMGPEVFEKNYGRKD
ncbi:MAG: tRNA-uridine aminocarboxypropyltransferase [Bacteriovorax sp.]|jgi:DTW domain-containing protein YfiP